MTVKVTLEYARDGSTLSSSGRITSNENGLVTEEGLPFSCLPFRDMLKQLATTLNAWPEEQAVEVVLQRTDRDGLLPYKLDDKTVELFRKDPVAAIAAFEYPTHSPSTTVRRVQTERTRHPVPSIRVGHDILADAFGDQVYFKVKHHELECPGCGFWGMFISPRLLTDPDRAGSVVKTAFVCVKRCESRFLVTCQEKWGYVDVRFLLEQTKLDAFYLPRAWNEGRPWVSREALQKKYDEYIAEKEGVICLDET